MTTTTAAAATTSKSATGSLTSAATGSSTSSLNKVNFDTFLKLLVAQLKNQDPLNPLDGTQFTAQIAQFSSLEQQINSNNYLKDLVAQRDYGQQTLAATYLNKDVLGPGDAFKKTSDNTLLGYKLSKPASDVTMEILDSKTGTVVRTFKLPGEEGNHTINWNGKDDMGSMAPNGNYTIRMTAFNSDGKKVGATGSTFGTVTSVLTELGKATLQLSDGRSVAMDDVLAVK